jgi:hypothetical protein
MKSDSTPEPEKKPSEEVDSAGCAPTSGSPSSCVRCGRETKTPDRCKCCEQEDDLKAAHDKAWEKNFIVPIAKEMKSRGVNYMVIILRDDGKAAYVLDTEIPENASLSHGDESATPTTR